MEDASFARLALCGPTIPERCVVLVFFLRRECLASSLGHHDFKCAGVSSALASLQPRIQILRIFNGALFLLDIFCMFAHPLNLVK